MFVRTVNISAGHDDFRVELDFRLCGIFGITGPAERRSNPVDGLLLLMVRH